MLGLCKFHDVLGKPGQGIHAARFLGMARNDLIGAGLVAGLLYWHGVPLWKAAVGVTLAFIAIHRIFCVNTALNKQIFGDV